MGVIERLQDASFRSLRRAIRLWSRPLVQGAEELNLPAESSVLYALPHRSLLDLLVFDIACEQAGMPMPRSPCTTPTLEERRSFFFLQRPEGRLFKRPTMRSYSERLLRVQTHLEQHAGEDIEVIPVSVFWSRAPGRERSFLRLLISENWTATGRLKRILSLLFNRHALLIQFGHPVSMRQLVDEQLPSNRTTRKLARLLRTHFRRRRAAVIGPDLSHRRTLVDSIIRSATLAEAIETEIERTGEKREKVVKRARGYAKEIASHVSFRVVRFFDVLLTFLWNRLYDGVRVHNLERLVKEAERAALVYVPCHRSHVDYLLLSYVLYQHGVALPQIAAGINLNIPIVGPLLRRAGGFFMRRTFRDNPLYSAVFNEYLFTLFSKGYSVEYFIEGGRSRTGRLLPPRGGMLAMTLHSFLRGGTQPISFVPVNISYEKVIEARSYLSELRGHSKEKESLFGLLRSLKTLRQSFGTVHVNIGEPLDLGEFLDSIRPDWTFGDPRPPWLNNAVTRLGRTLAERVNAAAVVNPVCLIALAMLCTQRQAIDEESLGRFLELLLRLGRQGANPASLQFEQRNPQEIIRYVESIGIIQREAHPLGDLLCVDGVNAILLTWYRNNIAHVYAYPSLIACFFVGHRRLTLEHLHQLCDTVYPHLRSELFLPWEPHELHEVTDQWVRTLVDCSMLEPQGDGYRASPRYSNDYAQLALLSRITMQTLERFYIVVALLTSRPNQSLGRDELEEWCHLTAQRMSRLYEIDAPEFFDRTLISNFIDGLGERNLIRENSQQKLVWDERLTEIIDEADRIIDPAFRETVMRGRVGIERAKQEAAAA